MTDGLVFGREVRRLLAIGSSLGLPALEPGDAASEACESVLLDLAIPDDEHVPPQSAKPPRVSCVPAFVPNKFWDPVSGVGPRES